MKLVFDKMKIVKDKANEVKSHFIFKNNRITDKIGNYVFNEEGIFSSKIFAKDDICECGSLTKTGYCEICKTRVISSSEPKPTYYIDFEGIVDIPSIKVDTYSTNIDPEVLTGLLSYSGFLYEGEYFELDLKELDLSMFDESKVLYGKDAILSLGVSEDWYLENTSDFIYISHKDDRAPILQSDGTYVINDLNKAYIDLLKRRHRLMEFLNSDFGIFNIITCKRLIVEAVNSLYIVIYNIINRLNKNIVNEHLKSQRVTGAIRAVITNDYSLDEDEILIGKYFLSTLYPNLKDRFGDDIYSVNEYLRLNEYLVLSNRQPSIGQKSIMAFKPVFTDDPMKEFVISLNPIVFDGFSADVDGDVQSIIAVYTKEANREIKKLLPSVNYIEGSNYTVRNDIPSAFKHIMNKLNISIDDKMDRKELIKTYKSIGKKMFGYYDTPTVADFSKMESNSLVKDVAKIEDVLKSIKRSNSVYTNEESDEYINSVVAANVTDIRESGYLYKKLSSASDNIYIKGEDCGSIGYELKLPISEETYNFKVRNHYITEFKDYTVSFKDFVEKAGELDVVHIRSVLYCKTRDSKCICKKCAGRFSLSKNSEFVPFNFGIYSTLMITEKATQSSLDSMNKGVTTKIANMIESGMNVDEINKDYETAITEMVDKMHSSNIESRFIETAFISRIHKIENKYESRSLKHSAHLNKDLMCRYIYQNKLQDLFLKLLRDGANLTSNKSKIAFDLYNFSKRN